MLTPSKIYAVKTRHPHSFSAFRRHRPAGAVDKSTKKIRPALIIGMPPITRSARHGRRPRPPRSYLNILKISNPSAYAIRLNNSTIPTICAYSMNLSLGLRPLIISTSVNNACPPSRAGIGNTFINASRMLKIAVNDQKLSQSHSLGKTLAILTTLPRLSWTFTSFEVNNNFRLRI